jgi:hypothetical protein
VISLSNGLDYGNVVSGSHVKPAGVNGTYFYARFTGYIIPPETGQYTIGVNSSDGANLFVAGQPVVLNLKTAQSANGTAAYKQSGTILLTAGAYYPIVVEWQHGTGANYELQLLWTPPASAIDIIPPASLSNVKGTVTGNIDGIWWNGTPDLWYPTGNANVDPSGPGVVAKGSTPASLSTPFKLATTTTQTTITTSPSCFFTRADGTMHVLGSTSQAVTGLIANNTAYYLPYFHEYAGTLNFVVASDITIPNITGITTVAASSQWIQTANSASIPPTFSVELWFKGSVAANQALYSFSNVQGTSAPASVEVQIYVNSSGEVVFGLHNTTPAWKTVTTAGASVLDGAWHHIICTYDPAATSGTMTVYVDSAKTSDNVTFWQTTSAGTVATTAGYWHIGFAAGFAGAPLTSNTFNSFTISHGSVFNTCLTVGQVGAHFQAYVNVGNDSPNFYYDAEITYDSAATYWKMTESAGATVADSIGSNTGTAQGSPTFNQTSPVVTVLGSPQIAWPYVTILALQFQYLQKHTPLGTLSAKNVAGGTGGGGGSGGSGGGGGGGRGGCFTGDTLVKTHRGNIAIRDVHPGDFCLTAKGTWRPVLARIDHEAERRIMQELPEGAITYNHEVLADGRWMKAGEVFKETVEVEEPVYTLSMLTYEPEELCHSPRTEHSFTLASGVVVTNMAMIVK